MKLRNKKTGEIEYFLFNSYPVSGDIVLEYMDENAESGYSEYCRYSSLAELNKEWEDYNPVEPLIKDENIRKAVRAWAEANKLNNLPIYYDANHNRFCDDQDFNIAIDFYDDFEGDIHHKHSYYLTDLCGEKEQ